MAGGTSSGPTPWWQLPGPSGAGQAANLDASAPPGYEYDRVQMKYVPKVASAPNAEANQKLLMNAIGGVNGGSPSVATGAANGVGSRPTVPYGGAGAGVGGVGGGSGGVPPMQSSGGMAPGGGGSVAAVPHMAPVDTSGAQRAEFGRAKDQVGLESSGALTGLRSSLGARGMLGSGAEARGTTAVAMKGQGELGDVSRTQAIDAITGQRADATANYAGDISQRGQDITTRGQDIQREEAGNTLASQNQNTNYLGQITQRGQDLGAGTAAAALAQEKQLNLMSMLQSAISGVGGKAY